MTCCFEASLERATHSGYTVASMRYGIMLSPKAVEDLWSL